METLVDCLLEREKSSPDELAYSFEHYRPQRVENLSWGQLARSARHIAAPRQRAGEPVLLLYPAGLDLYQAFWAALLAGRLPLAVQAPSPLRRDRVERALAAAAQAAACREVWTLSEHAPLVPPGYQIEFTDSRHSAQPPLARPGNPIAYLQLTSGTTSTARAVPVTHASALWMCRTLHATSGLLPSCVVVGWLPPYHDMGLILQLLGPAVAGGRSHVLAPLDFLQRPLRWLQAISEQRATHTAAPNFALRHCLERISQCPPELSLSSLCRLYNGSETVQKGDVEAFRQRFAPFGLKPHSLVACYGLAEATLLVSGASPPQRNYLEVDLRALRAGRILPASPGLPLASCGAVAPDTQVRIGPGGEIWVRGPGVMTGYYNHPPLEKDSWLATGDLGFLYEEELYITGRCKDAIILNGANYGPLEFESLAQEHGESAAAFSVPGEKGEELVILLETRSDLHSQEIPRRVQQSIAHHLGVVAHHVILQRVGSLERTSSGKIRRQACRQKYLERP